jgi:DNA-binding SARP family transcriptional activator/TolB-like protein
MIRLKTFGAPGLQRDDAPVAVGAAQGRRLGLLAMLAVAGDEGVSRDKLVAYLWPDAGEDQARHTLAQSVYLLRRDLAAGEVVVGTSELRLNREAIETDVGEFKRALDAGDVDRAAAIYAGPFLDGFYLSGAPEFERWVETERNRFAKQAHSAFERAARDAIARRDPHRAVEWWRRVAAAEPLDARAAIGLIESLAAVGDRSGALQHARIHETMVREELDAAPDPAVTALVERLRAGGMRAGSVSESQEPEAGRLGSDRQALDSHNEQLLHSDVKTPARQPSRRSRVWATRGAGVTVAALVLLALIGARVIRGHHTDSAFRATRTFAIGAVRDYSGVDTSGIARALTDMLATNLARVPDLRVVSNARIYELVGTARAELGRDLAAQLSTAARQAGATEIVDGALYRYRPGMLRFDVRRVDLATGAIRKAYSVEGADPFELVDRATAEVAADVSSASTGALHVADVTTKSLVGYRFYEEGLRAYYQQNDLQGARRLFLAALAEDSTFAMAEYYAAHCELSLGIGQPLDRFAHAARLAERATDRERLMVRGTVAQVLDEPSVAVADTLAKRYPAEADGHYLLGEALIWRGDFLAALPHLRRVVEMDSSSLHGSTARCRACDAMSAIATAYWLADSLPAAERTARQWVRAQPSAPGAWRLLAGMELYQDHYDDARMTSREVMRLFPGFTDPFFDALMSMRLAHFGDADATLRRKFHEDPTSEAGWLLTLSLRYQGRLRDALAVARQSQQQTMDRAQASAPNLSEAIILFDMGRDLEAAALFSARGALPGFRPEFSGRIARDRTWNLTHEATARAAAGDTAALPRLADSIQHVGMSSAYGRDQRLHHYVRGLLLRARGQLPAAVDEFRLGIFSSTDGYTRNSYELARTLLTLHRTNEAIAVLEPAFRGSLQASNSYVTHTELHEVLAQAFEAAGQPDSAAAHYRYVVSAWAHADPQFRARWEQARARLTAIGYLP